VDSWPASWIGGGRQRRLPAVAELDPQAESPNQCGLLLPCSGEKLVSRQAEEIQQSMGWNQ
jgi:hypothetical protein